MSADKDQLLRQFCDVTGADESRSRFFLDSSNWQLEIALSSFYEHGGNVDEPVPNQDLAAPPQALSDSDMESPPVSPPRPKKESKQPSDSKFRTLESLQQDTSSDDEEGQAFYAGGSERSGQQILGPGKNRKDFVTEMFKSVRERGAVVFEDEPSGGRGRAAFSGVGYRLGQTADDHEPVSVQQSNTSQQDQARSVRLCLYREGFTVDGGALRPYTDPEHAQFLSCIRRGEIPPELASNGTEVRVSLEDRRHEPCPRSSAKQHAFTGKGQMLGSPTPPTIGATVPIAADPADREANIRAAQQAVGVDESRPTTTLQFRLTDGSVLTGRFNDTHTVEDLHLYITRAVPSYATTRFQLATTFPRVDLIDKTATIAGAKLQNSTLLLRMN